MDPGDRFKERLLLSLSLFTKGKRKKNRWGDLSKMKILYKYISLLHTDSYYKYEHPVNILGYLDREKIISFPIWQWLTHV